MNKSEIIKVISEKTGQPLTTVGTVVDTLISVMQGQLAGGDKITLPSFGSFCPKDIVKHSRRNPRTGEIMMMNQERKIIFKPSDSLVHLIQPEGTILKSVDTTKDLEDENWNEFEGEDISGETNQQEQHNPE